MLKFSLRALTCALLVAGTVPAVAAPRCPAPYPEIKQQMDALGIVELCSKIDDEINKSWHQFPTDIITGGGQAIGAIPPGAVVWTPRTRTVRFSIPSGPEYSNYGICNFGWRRIISEIPGHGKYLQHGWQKLTERSVEYRWVLKRQGIFKGKTSLHADVFFAYIPTSNLEKAREAGLCMKVLKLPPWRK
jgi:hypothetical protein